MAKAKFEEWLTDDGLLLLRSWAREGYTDLQIAQKCGITTTTLYRWKNSHSAICDALKETKEIVDRMVENALLKRAMGYSYEEITRIYRPDEEGNQKLIDTKIIVKEVAPDTTAQIFWLKNRQRDGWKNDHDKAQIDRERIELEKLMTAAQINKIEREADKDQAQDIEVIFGDKIEEGEWQK